MHPRFIRPAVENALADTPVVLLHGPRQAGKTTLAQEIGRQRGMRYVTLDDASVLSAAQSDADGFIAGLKDGAVIDEVQRATDLFRAVKGSVDRDRKPGRFLLTGSANVMLLPSLSESLAGRMESLTLLPLSQGELRDRRETFVDRVFGDDAIPVAPDSGEPRVIQVALAGGYPEAVSRTNPARRTAWFESYIAAILQRDVRDLANIEGLTEMPRLLKLLATRSAGLLNYADLSRTLGIPQTTLKRYFTLLETTFLVRTLPAWSGNAGLRLAKAPKVHIVDSGLLAGLTDLNEERLSADPTRTGALLETFVAGEIIKQLGWSRTRAQPHHFRTSGGQEVDLVLEDSSGRVVGIEIKASATVTKADFSGLRALRDAAGDRFVRGVVISASGQTVPFEGSQLLAAPVTSLWA